MFRSVHRVLGALAAAILLTIALSGCGGGGGGGGGREPVHGSYSRSNPTAQDLLDHWNDPEQLRAAMGLQPLDAATASQPELYGYGAWGRYSGWGAGVERTIRYEGGRVVDAHDTLRAAADAFGMAPGASLADTLTALQGDATWSGPLIGVDLGQAMLPPVFGDAELRVELVSMDGTAVFDDLTVHADGVSSAFRAPRLRYAIDVTENAFSDENGHVRGSFFGPAHEEMAGVLDDRTATVNLLAGFGGRR